MTTTTAHPAAATPADPGDGSVTSARLRQIVDEMNARFRERGTVIRAIIAAMLARQHSLLIGPPGSAKSELARDLTDRIDGATQWETQLNAFTAPTQMFGPIDVAALVKGRYEQVWDGRATRADIAFIDEIFKCGPGALDALLAFLNERLYHPESGGQPISCPLISAITASNELPRAGESAAVYDRLLVRVEVGYLDDPTNFAWLLRQGAAPAGPRTRILLSDLVAAVNTHVPAVGIPDQVVDGMVTLRSALRHAGVVASDRRWRQSVRLLQACAWLDGRDQISVNDLDILSHVLWTDPAERRTVEKEVLEVVNPDASKALDILDGVEGMNAELDALKGTNTEDLAKWAAEASQKLAKAAKELQGLAAKSKAEGRSTAAVDDTLDRVRQIQARVMVDALGVDASVAKSMIQMS
ncbi:AAA family ATPase [Planotetraspora sp. GP83]|uniref:AAA family ATPase n=1 Tax=Planotetraspora sp. GP83 TaxID=3156264 RepID=UPI0035115B19